MFYTLPGISFLLCLALTPIIRQIAIRKGWMAHPTQERWHKKPTALFGGIAIYLGIAVPTLFLTDFSTLVSQITMQQNGKVLPSPFGVLWVGATVLFILGLMDDIIHIKPHTKLVGQIIVASFVTFLGFRLQWFTSLTLDTMVTIVWIVGITNAFNLLDNMDGLCAGVGFIAALTLALLFWGTVPAYSILALIIAGALLAFLIFNFNPASIFMGDSGSLLIGFTLSMLALLHSENGGLNQISLYAVPVMIMMVPILDTTLVTLIRILSGRKASAGGKDHTSHRLVLMGMSEKGASLFLYGIGAISGLSAIFVDRTDTLTSPVVIIPVGLSILLMGIYLAQLRVYPEKEFSLLRDRAYTPILIELTYKRQLLLVILDFGLIAFAYYLSYRLRFDGAAFPIYFKVFLRSLPAVIALKFLAFFVVGIYRGIWQYMSTSDVYVYMKASLFASLLAIVAVTFIYRFENFSKGIFVIDWFLTTGLLLGTRGSFRLFVDTMKRKTLAGDAVLIYGAGRGGEILLREILNNPSLGIKPMGFIDDDPLKSGKKLQGYPIMGSFSNLDKLIKDHPVNGLLLSFMNKDIIHQNKIKQFCRTKGLYLKQFSVCFDEIDLSSK
jgi:UDP-GlcNAc:undecaprenyl-phosphate GlcNAc-1-phosphate transferase